jgi:prepilin-type N-terminal cleavage/methylation domain-containing protein
MYRPAPTHRHWRTRGFTLLEMAIVLVIVGFLLSGMLSGMSALQLVQREDGTQRQLEEMRIALITFATINRRLPCPAAPATAETVAGAGLERAPTVAGCTGGAAGAFPWATLGLPQTDAWGRRFSYRVTPAFARLAPAITMASVGDNTVQNLSAVSVASQVPAVIVSHGRDGAGSRNRLGALAAAGSNAGQVENSDADAIFVSDIASGGFDDLVVWLPLTTLLGRMIEAGALP